MNQRFRLTRRASLVPLALLPLATSGCGLFDWLTDDAAAPIPGNREPVLSPTRGLQVDAALSSVTLPPVVVNADWPQVGGGPTHVGGNLAGGLTKAWSVKIGKGGAYRQRLTSQPLVAGNQVFTMDTDGAVASFDLASGHRLWSTGTRPKKNRTSNLGGGIAVAGGRVYAATGRSEVLALDAGDGHIVWRAPLNAPARSSPTVVGDLFYVTTLDQTLVAISNADGKTIWSYKASPAEAAVLSQAAPAFADGLVVAGFESGDLAAVRADSGTLAWSDNLGALQGSASLLEFSTVRGAPVIDGGIVYAIGLGGLMAALDLRSGRRVWERDIAGQNTPWIAGGTLFLVSTDQKVAALSKEDGSVNWVSDLPRFENPKRTKGLISWTGPTLVGGKLLLVSTDEHMAVLDPVDGKVVSVKTEIGSSGSVAPVAAQGTVLVLTDDAVLTAYK